LCGLLIGKAHHPPQPQPNTAQHIK
jgi:hypothetical protein